MCRVKCFKGILVTQDYLQQYGIDYDEIFIPVACFSSIHILLAFAVENKMEILQLDVVSAFLMVSSRKKFLCSNLLVMYSRGKNLSVRRKKNTAAGMRSFVNT